MTGVPYRNNNWTAAEIRRIRELRAKGITWRAIGIRFGTGGSVVAHAVEAAERKERAER
jgi:hypothetical protein